MIGRWKRRWHRETRQRCVLYNVERDSEDPFWFRNVLKFRSQICIVVLVRIMRLYTAEKRRTCTMWRNGPWKSDHLLPTGCGAVAVSRDQYSRRVCVCVVSPMRSALRQSVSTVVTTNDCCVAVASLPAAAIVADLVRRRHRKWPVFGRR